MDTKLKKADAHNTNSDDGISRLVRNANLAQIRLFQII